MPSPAPESRSDSRRTIPFVVVGFIAATFIFLAFNRSSGGSEQAGASSQPSLGSSPPGLGSVLPSVGSVSPSGGSNRPDSADPVFVGAGDIATCKSDGDLSTAQLIDGIPGTVFTLGDNAYAKGTPSEFTNCYDPTWGRFMARTKPTTGNREYSTPGAAGYFGYFRVGSKAIAPYYAFDLGTWRIYSLNSEIDVAAGSAQVRWLRADLAAQPRACVLAYWHQPRFSSAKVVVGHRLDPLWGALYEAHADVVLNGHHHDYERFAPQTPQGVLDLAHGIREFVVGTGGYGLTKFGVIKPYSEVHNDTTHGVLKLTLHADSYDWEFIPVSGSSFTDSGTASCN